MKHSRREFLIGTAAVASAGPCLDGLLVGKATAASVGSAVTGGCKDINRPMADVVGKVAFITGGSSGIGLGIARAFVDAGMKVAIGYRGQRHLDEAVEVLKDAQDRFHAVQVEVTNRQNLEQAAIDTTKHFGKVHVIVANAGAQSPATLSAMTLEDWNTLMRVNVDGVFHTVQSFLPSIRAHGEGGQVVTTASIFGLLTVGGTYAAYCASKFAVVAMMESLRVELEEENIGVSALCPGVVKTNLENGLRDLPFAADPLEIGRAVLRGMRDNDLYILTNPEFTPFYESRFLAIRDSIPRYPKPSHEALSAAHSMQAQSIYARERQRLGCLKRE